MKISLPADVRLNLGILYAEPGAPMLARVYKQNEFIGECVLKGDSQPEIRYLIILYFYNENIPVNGKTPHAITLEEYRKLYQAMFDRECVYQDKQTSLDYLRSHAAENKLLKPCGIRFARGGLCAFNSGVPDQGMRDEFRAQLIEELSNIPCPTESERNRLNKRLSVLKGYLASSPAAYMGVETLLRQSLKIAGNELWLYGERALDFAELLKRHRLIHLGGQCGSGKTTLLKYIALNMELRSNFSVYERRLANETRLYSSAELEQIRRYPMTKHLFLLDGFNELPRTGKARTRAISDINALKEYSNVYIVISSTGAPSIFRDFTAAELGNVLPEISDDAADDIVTQTPLIYNAYRKLPRVVRERMTNEFSVLEYSSRAKIEAVIERGSEEGAVNARVAYYAMLPMLSEQMCIEARVTFDESAKTALFDKIRRSAGDAYMREVFLRLGESLPAISEWSPERMEYTFFMLIENGEIETRGGMYAFKHQSIRDFYAVNHEVGKLRLMLEGVPGINECVQFNLGQYCRTLLMQALEINALNGLSERYGLASELMNYNEQAPDYALSMRRVLLFNATAQMFEYVVTKANGTWSKDKVYYENLKKAMSHLSDNSEEIKRMLENSHSSELFDAIAFPFCKTAELSINRIHSRDDAYQGIEDCANIVDSGIEILRVCPRLTHSKAKSMLYKAVLLYRKFNDDEAKRCLLDGYELLKLCMVQGSWFSANLVAFMARYPVPMAVELMGSKSNPVQGFIINMKTTAREDIHGLIKAYPCNEAIDAILMGEVKINLFSGMRGFIEALSDETTLRAAVSEGDGKPGRKALKLAKQLLQSRDETMSDDYPMTLFYRFMLDWHELHGSLSANEASRRLSEMYSKKLKQKYNRGVSTVQFNPLQLYYFQEELLCLMALCFINENLSDDIDYLERLKYYLSAIIDALKTMSKADRDTTGVDTDHCYYISKRLIYYLDLFTRQSPQSRPAQLLKNESEQLRLAMEELRGRWFEK